MTQLQSTEDYSHTLLEQEEYHFYSSVADVLDAFQTHGVDHVLEEVSKNTFIKQQLRAWLDRSA